MSSEGITLIAYERQRQIAQEGWSLSHDDAHTTGQLISAAAAYQIHSLLGLYADDPPLMWPWDKSWWKPSEDPIRNLVKAGALIAAEIDRLQRIKNKD